MEILEMSSLFLSRSSLTVKAFMVIQLVNWLILIKAIILLSCGGQSGPIWKTLDEQNAQLMKQLKVLFTHDNDTLWSNVQWWSQYKIDQYNNTTNIQGSVLGCPKPVLGRTVPKTWFKPAFYCPKLSKTAQNRPKLSETANWLRKCQIDTWIDIKFAKLKLPDA